MFLKLFFGIKNIRGPCYIARPSVGWDYVLVACQFQAWPLGCSNRLFSNFQLGYYGACTVGR